jgi:Transposase IS116/IS110/IS902 family
MLAQIAAAADLAGYQRLLVFGQAQVPGRRCWAVEGAGSYGAGLTAFLQARAASGWWRSGGPSGRRAEPAPRATPWTPFGRRGRPWPVRVAGASHDRPGAALHSAPHQQLATEVLVSWSHAGRLHSEAAFAALAGTNPIPASSGQVARHRLDRSGDRQLNRALHTIVLARLRDDPETAAMRLGGDRRARAPVISADA